MSNTSWTLETQHAIYIFFWKENQIKAKLQFLNYRKCKFVYNIPTLFFIEEAWLLCGEKMKIWYCYAKLEIEPNPLWKRWNQELRKCGSTSDRAIIYGWSTWVLVVFSAMKESFEMNLQYGNLFYPTLMLDTKPH